MINGNELAKIFDPKILKYTSNVLHIKIYTIQVEFVSLRMYEMAHSQTIRHFTEIKHNIQFKDRERVSLKAHDMARFLISYITSREHSNKLNRAKRLKRVSSKAHLFAYSTVQAHSNKLNIEQNA